MLIKIGFKTPWSEVFFFFWFVVKEKKKYGVLYIPITPHTSPHLDTPFLFSL